MLCMKNVEDVLLFLCVVLFFIHSMQEFQGSCAVYNSKKGLRKNIWRDSGRPKNSMPTKTSWRNRVNLIIDLILASRAHSRHDKEQ